MPLLPGRRRSGVGQGWRHAGDQGQRRWRRLSALERRWRRQLHWSLGPTLFSAERSAMFADAPLAKDAKPAKFEPPKTGVSLSMRVAADKPGGRIAIVGARIVTMAGADGGVIENGVDPDRRQPHRGGRASRRDDHSRGRADARRQRQDDHSRADRCPCARALWRSMRSSRSQNWSAMAQSRAGRDDASTTRPAARATVFRRARNAACRA